MVFLPGIAVVIGLAQHSSAHDQPGLGQQVGNTVRLPPVEIERDLVTPRFGPARELVADLECELDVATGRQDPMELGEDARQAPLPGCG